METKNLKFDTKLIHGGEPSPLIEKAVTMPIFQSSTYEIGESQSGEINYNDIKYVRLNNTPNHLAIHEKIAQIEMAEAALVSSSGMASISSALLGLIGFGEHVLAQDNLYGGTYHFLKEFFPKMGREVTFFPLEDINKLPMLLKKNTRAIYVESISNPLLRVPDLKEVVKFAQGNGLISMIDNTFPSPVNFNPIPFGFDVALHSATKYLNGHSDVVAGAMVSRKDLIKKVTPLFNHLGGCLDPHACFLLHRGMKTLGARVRYQNESALKVSGALEKCSKVARVIYPGLRSHPDHLRAREWFRGFGGMLSFEFAGDAVEADTALKRLKIPFLAPSLGGVESLYVRPATASHSSLSKGDREKLGIKDTLVRVSIGLEDTQDLIDDFTRVLN
ncbi:MAG: aminotransferase class I/II-fold pyridoxal phosphate-dependent enzyme [Deltaproteobacteria bacterium]|nr:aminotransferase class I/II-fold pyridoxal phosphate-dependent enzyme [Deltaproteobacteria bacterium]